MMTSIVSGFALPPLMEIETVGKLHLICLYFNNYLSCESESLHNTDFLIVIFHQAHKPSTSEIDSPQTTFSDEFNK